MSTENKKSEEIDAALFMCEKIEQRLRDNNDDLETKAFLENFQKKILDELYAKATQ